MQDESKPTDWSQANPSDLQLLISNCDFWLTLLAGTPIFPNPQDYFDKQTCVVLRNDFVIIKKVLERLKQEREDQKSDRRLQI